MDCPAFTKWLENRDMYDVSEADKALKHTAQCGDCTRKLQLDEQLDALLIKAFKTVEMPASLQDRADLSLDRESQSRSKKRYGWYGLASAAIAAVVVLGLFFPFSPEIASMDDLVKHVVADHRGHDDTILVVHETRKLGKLGEHLVAYETIRQEMPASNVFVGARICTLGECKAVHVVYRDGAKRISLFLVKTSDIGFSIVAGRKYSITMGEQVVHLWKKGDFVYATVG